MGYVASAARYQSIENRRSGKSGIMLPAISLGLWHNFGHIDSFQNAGSILKLAFDCVITHFDLANNYGPPPGSAEENFGKIFIMILPHIGMKCLFQLKLDGACGKDLMETGDQKSTL